MYSIILGCVLIVAVAWVIRWRQAKSPTDELMKPFELEVCEPILKAAQDGCIEALESELCKGIAANFIGERGLTAMQLASIRGHVDIVRKLLSMGAKTSAVGNLVFPLEGWTSLHFAVNEKQFEVVKLLLEVGADANSKADSVSPLELAVRRGSCEITKLLLENGATPSDQSDIGFLLGIAKTQHNSNLVNLLWNPPDKNPVQHIVVRHKIHDAAASGDVHLVEELAKSSSLLVNVTDSDRLTPLDYAVINGHIGIAELLLRHGADPRKPRYPYGPDSPLYQALRCDNVEIFGLLYGQGIPTSGWLLTAVEMGKVGISEWLLQKGVDVNVRSPYEKSDWATGEDTPLHLAVRQNNPDIVKLLIAKGADVNATNQDVWTPLHTAAQYGHPEMVKLLIEAGADVNAEGGWDSVNCRREGFTPLFYAESQRHLEVAKLLIQSGALK